MVALTFIFYLSIECLFKGQLEVKTVSKTLFVNVHVGQPSLTLIVCVQLISLCKQENKYHSSTCAHDQEFLLMCSFGHCWPLDRYLLVLFASTPSLLVHSSWMDTMVNTSCLLEFWECRMWLNYSTWIRLFNHVEYLSVLFHSLSLTRWHVHARIHTNIFLIKLIIFLY